MRRLAWFAGGFGAACLWACYFPPGTRPMLIAFLAAGLGLAGWLSTRPRAGEHPVLLRRGRDKGRYKLYQLSRRVLALGLGAGGPRRGGRRPPCCGRPPIPPCSAPRRRGWRGRRFRWPGR